MADVLVGFCEPDESRPTANMLTGLGYCEDRNDSPGYFARVRNRCQQERFTGEFGVLFDLCKLILAQDSLSMHTSIV